MVKKLWRYFFLLLCSVLLAYLVVRAARLERIIAHVARPSRLFSSKVIESRFSPKKEWNIKTSPQQERLLYVISQQTLRWLGRGMQSVVFETQDEKYVIKFFQLGKLSEDIDQPTVKTRILGSSQKKRQELINRREELFSSSKMCFEDLQEETGIIYVHLNRSRDRIHTLRLVDRYGQSHRIRGDETSFLVQKKARYLVPTITSYMEEGQVDQAKARIDQVLNLLLALAEKGYVDNDDALIRNNNLGLTEERAIYIDTGHLYRDKNLDVAARMKYEFQVRLDPFEKWLRVAYPELAAHYQIRKELLLTSLNPTEKSQ